MNPEIAIDITRRAVEITLLVGSPIMVVAMVVGLIISLFQAVTQLQEQTLSFVPKIIAMLLVTLYLLPWLFDVMITYTTTLIQEIPSTI